MARKPATTKKAAKKPGPKTAAGKAKALANLTPFKPGQSGNPAGRPAAGASIREWVNQMADWPVSKIEAVFKDVDAAMSKLAAARCCLDAVSRNYTNTGIPVARGDLDFIMDRTDGKPLQRVDVKSDTTVRSADEAARQLLDDPDAAELARRVARRHAVESGGPGDDADEA